MKVKYSGLRVILWKTIEEKQLKLKPVSAVHQDV